MLLEEGFPHAELRGDTDNTITVDSERESIFALPWTFLSSRDEQIFVGINRDRLTVHIPGVAARPWQELAPLTLHAWESYVAVSRPSGHRRMGLADTHRFFYHHDDGPEFNVSDLFRLSPRFAGDIPGSFGHFQIQMDLRFDGDDDDIVRVILRTDGAFDSPNIVVFALTLDYMRILGPALERDAVAAWLEGAHQRLASAFDTIVKPAALATFGERG